MADVTATVSTVVKVVDQATGPLKGISAQFAKFTAPLQGMSAKLKGLGDTTGLSNLGKNLGGIAQKAGGVAKSIAGIGLSLVGLGGIAGGLGLRSVVGWMNDMTEAGGALHDTAPKIGVTVEKLQELQHWAKMGGVEAGTMQGAVAKLNKNLGDISTGKGKAAAETFKKLGITTTDAKGKMKGAGDLLPEIADGLKKIENPAERAQVAMALFGRSGVEMLPALLEGGKAIRDAAAEAQKLGVISSADAAAADTFGEAQENLGKAIRATQMAIGAKLLPVLLPVIEGMRDWVMANREWIATKFGDALTAIGDALKAVDWAGWGESLKTVFGYLQRFVELIGGVDKAVMLLAGVKFAGPLMALAGTLGTILSTLGTVASAIGLFTPVGAILAAVAAAAFLIYKNWDLIGPVVEKTWQAIKTGVGDAVDAIKGFAKGVGEWLGGALERVGDWGKRLVAAFADVWTDVKQGMATALGAMGDVLGPVLEPLKDAAARAFDNLKAAFEAGWQGVSGVIELLKSALGSIAGLLDRVAGVARSVAGFFGTIVEGVRSQLPAAVDTAAAEAEAAQQRAADKAAVKTQRTAERAAGRGPGPWLPDIAAPGTPASGQVEVVITAPNQPPGTRVAASSSGAGLSTRTDVGYSMPQLQPGGA